MWREKAGFGALYGICFLYDDFSASIWKVVMSIPGSEKKQSSLPTQGVADSLG
jgi:hypothetical protein